MDFNGYHFITRWRVKASLDEINEVLKEAADLPRWWPSVYLDVKILEPGDENYIGRKVSLYTKGWLPYTLRWDFEVTDSYYPYGSRIEARGDFDGRGIWTFEPDGEYVNITYDWKITAEKGLLKTLSFLLKPVFKLNHEWAMAKGLQSLKLELARRRAPDDIARSFVPPPPPPATPLPFILGAAAVFLALVWLGSFYLRKK